MIMVSILQQTGWSSVIYNNQGKNQQNLAETEQLCSCTRVKFITWYLKAVYSRAMTYASAVHLI